MTDNTGNSLDEADSSSEMNALITVNGAEPGRFGATTTAGSGALAKQQFVRTDWLDLDVREQQLCAVLCAGCRQIQEGVSNVPINRMATAARWKTPRNMDTGYHEFRILR
jgi:hypothetical protein